MKTMTMENKPRTIREIEKRIAAKGKDAAQLYVVVDTNCEQKHCLNREDNWSDIQVNETYEPSFCYKKIDAIRLAVSFTSLKYRDDVTNKRIEWGVMSVKAYLKVLETKFSNQTTQK